MSQYQSFFISAGGNAAQCDELNHFLRSHVVIRTVENIISSGNNCGIQILVEYKDVGVNNQQDKKNAKIDWRASLATEEQRTIFDRLKEIRLEISKANKLTAAYVVCKDEHLAAIITKPDITAEEIAELPNSKNIMLRKFAQQLHEEYQKILKEMQGKNIAENDGGFDRLNHREFGLNHRKWKRTANRKSYKSVSCKLLSFIAGSLCPGTVEALRLCPLYGRFSAV